jgi:hypothetical protein
MRKTPAWKTNNTPKDANQGIYIGPTYGKSSPKNARRGCLCRDGKTYSRDCCDGYLINQGIGQTEVTRGYRGAFSRAFSNAFDISQDEHHQM